MRPRIYTSYQAAALALLKAVHVERVTSRAVIRLEIEAQLKDRLNDLELKESRAANDALRAGVTKTDIGRAIGTANFQTIVSVLARTATDFPKPATINAAAPKASGISMRVGPRVRLPAPERGAR